MSEELEVLGLEPLVELAVLKTLEGSEIADGLFAPYKGTISKAYIALGVFLSYGFEPAVEPVANGAILFTTRLDDKEIFFVVGRSEYQINVTKDGYGTIASVTSDYVKDYFLDNTLEYIQIFYSNLN